MKLIALALFFLLCCYGLMAQNLVPNGSFEDYTDCPWNDYLVYLCKGWNSYRGSPDYYNRCDNTSFVGVPNNWLGHQEAATGNACMGLLTYGYTISTSIKYEKEIIGNKLTIPLQKGIKYYVSFKISLADSSAIASDKLGILFSTVPYLDEYDSTNYPAPLINKAMVYSHSVITDTVNWITISGSFVADSAYQYIMIGNFFDDAHTDTIRIRNYTVSGNYYAYYYIDDVCLSKDSFLCNPVTDDIELISSLRFKIFPNPVYDKLFIISEGDIECKYSLYSIYGDLIQSSKVKGTRSIDVTEIPSGIYFLQIHHKNTITRQKLIIIH